MINCRCMIVAEFEEPGRGGEVMRELWETVRDAWREGDWIGHLRAWWAVARGRVTPQTRAGWPAR